MAITVNEVTKVIFIPQADLISLGGSNYELDTEWFRLQLKIWEASTEGGYLSRTHLRAPPATVGGVTIAQSITIINGYTITFEDGQYRVILTGSNNNILDVANLNQVSIGSTNSAGLVAATQMNDLMEADHFYDQSTGLLHYYKRGTTEDLIPPKTVTGTTQPVDASLLE